MFRSTPRAASSIAVLVGLCWPCLPLTAQLPEATPDTTVVVADSSDLVSVARAAQANFERRRLHHLPVSFDVGAGRCDEHVGRFCTWYSEGEWYPVAEEPEIVALRTELLAVLDSLQGNLPGDDWLLGQRVWYRSEAGDWEGALATARSCGGVEPWWCAALEGFALHGLGRYGSAEQAFVRALERMDPERAEEWRLPRRAVDSDLRSLLDQLREGAVPPDTLAAVLDRVWTLSDPLWLIDGNDRLTAHYARWTVSTLRDDARNPFHIGWGSDLEELTIRHGWEIGWERSPRRDFAALDHVIGHKHPEGRDYMPPGRVVQAPASAAPEDLWPDRRVPRSLYAPDYAPLLLPMDGQLAVFPRGEEMVVVSTHFLPEDTTFHAEHDHPLPWLDPGDQAGEPDRIGLHAVEARGGRPRGVDRTGAAEGALLLRLPTAAWVVSAETWSPSLRRAGRLRMGVPARAAPEDVATLSDLLMLRPASEDPTLLEEALTWALPRPRILPGQTFAIAWEVSGLGFSPETLRFELSVERTDRNVVRRIGEFLGLADRPQPLALSWEEPAPATPGAAFHYLELDLPPLDSGEYRIRLALRTANRTDAVTTRVFEVRERD